jgi:hypothetical protein
MVKETKGAVPCDPAMQSAREKCKTAEVARTVEAAAEAVERQSDEALNREQWDAYAMMRKICLRP